MKMERKVCGWCEECDLIVYEPAEWASHREVCGAI